MGDLGLAFEYQSAAERERRRDGVAQLAKRSAQRLMMDNILRPSRYTDYHATPLDLSGGVAPTNYHYVSRAMRNRAEHYQQARAAALALARSETALKPRTHANITDSNPFASLLRIGAALKDALDKDHVTDDTVKQAQSLEEAVRKTSGNLAQLQAFHQAIGELYAAYGASWSANPSAAKQMVLMALQGAARAVNEQIQMSHATGALGLPDVPAATAAAPVTAASVAAPAAAPAVAPAAPTSTARAPGTATPALAALMGSLTAAPTATRATGTTAPAGTTRSASIAAPPSPFSSAMGPDATAVTRGTPPRHGTRSVRFDGSSPVVAVLDSFRVPAAPAAASVRRASTPGLTLLRQRMVEDADIDDEADVVLMAPSQSRVTNTIGANFVQPVDGQLPEEPPEGAADAEDDRHEKALTQLEQPPAPPAVTRQIHTPAPNLLEVEAYRENPTLVMQATDAPIEERLRAYTILMGENLNGLVQRTRQDVLDAVDAIREVAANTPRPPTVNRRDASRMSAEQRRARDLMYTALEDAGQRAQYANAQVGKDGANLESVAAAFSTRRDAILRDVEDRLARGEDVMDIYTIIGQQLSTAATGAVHEYSRVRQLIEQYQPPSRMRGFGEQGGV